jgi:hypothetical protein
MLSGVAMNAVLPGLVAQVRMHLYSHNVLVIAAATTRSGDMLPSKHCCATFIAEVRPHLHSHNVRNADMAKY